MSPNNALEQQHPRKTPAEKREKKRLLMKHTQCYQVITNILHQRQVQERREEIHYYYSLL